MSAGAPDIELRPARSSDEGFLLALYASTRTDELSVLPWADEQKTAFLAQQFAAQSSQYATHYPDASFDVVLVDGEPAGRLTVARSQGELRIVDVALLPEYRGMGIGTALINRVIAEADSQGATVSLHVERSNPALRLYGRLGFTRLADEGVYLWLRRRSPDRSSRSGPGRAGR